MSSSRTDQDRERIRHPRIAQIIDDVQLMLDAGRNSSLLMISGPTGVGKTTLGKYLVEAELDQQMAAIAADPGFVPAIRVEAPSSGEKEFSWRMFYENILTALDGEFSSPRQAYGVDAATGRVVRPLGPQTHRLAGLRTAVERSFRERRTRFVVVDEAAHMMRQCNPHQLERQLDTLKSLSNQCGVQWVLLGSYDLFELMSLSGQLARRTHVMHFSRYRQDDAGDVQVFKACLKHLSSRMPALKNLDLLPFAENFQSNTLGCIGTLRDVLERLDRLVSDRGWTEQTLCSALMTETQVNRILQEVLEGEERIAPGLHRSLNLNKRQQLSKKIA